MPTMLRVCVPVTMTTPCPLCVPLLRCRSYPRVCGGCQPDTYLKGCAKPSKGLRCPRFPTLATAQAACASDTYADCRGVTVEGDMPREGAQLRAGSNLISVDPERNETSYLITNAAACKGAMPPPPPLPPGPPRPRKECQLRITLV